MFTNFQILVAKIYFYIPIVLKIDIILLTIHICDI